MLAVWGTTHLYAQSPAFVAEVSANRFGIKDQVQVSYTIYDARNLEKMSPASSPDVEILKGPYQSGPMHSVTIINGKRSESYIISLTYVMRARRTGIITIPPAVAEYSDGRTVQSNSVQVDVVPGAPLAEQEQRRRKAEQDYWDQIAAMQRQRQQYYQQQMAQVQKARQQQQQQQAAAISEKTDVSKDIFIRVTVDKNKVYVGEQVTASYKLYARIPMQMGISKLPSLNGFWTQDFEIPKNIKPVEETYNGKKYQVFVLKKSALFPQQTGTLELDAAEAEGMARVVQTVRQSSPFADFFDDPAIQRAFGGSLMMNDPFFNQDMFEQYVYRDIPVKAKSTPVKITVEPLPEDGKPAGYGGAVGNFNISATVDKNTFSTDDVANLRVTIMGSGNLKLIEAPALNLPNGLSHFDPVALDTVTGRSTTISGSKIITYPISANAPGDYEIPALSFSYYNPQTGSYIVHNTQPIKLHIQAGKNYAPGIAAKGGMKDIHTIATVPLSQLTFASRPLLHSVGYWSMYAVPLMAFVGIAFWRRREDELSRDVVRLKNRKANKIALRRLATAQKLLQQKQQTPFYEEVSKAIWLYLSDKLNIPLSALSKESAREALSTRNVPQHLQLTMERVISDCETALYAPSGGSQQMNQTYQDAVSIISSLEETFNS
ncbi:MAG: protein BatD [Flavipsychrobacter sp.]|nr:protein BatD [Flavipsychrobacter sp.]